MKAVKLLSLVLLGFAVVGCHLIPSGTGRTVKVPMLAGSSHKGISKTLIVSADSFPGYQLSAVGDVASESVFQVDAPLLTGWNNEDVHNGDHLTYTVLGHTVSVTVSINADNSITYQGIFDDGQSWLVITVGSDQSNFSYEEKVLLDFYTSSILTVSKMSSVDDQYYVHSIMNNGVITTDGYTGSGDIYLYNVVAYNNYPPDNRSIKLHVAYQVKKNSSFFGILGEEINYEALYNQQSLSFIAFPIDDSFDNLIIAAGPPTPATLSFISGYSNGQFLYGYNQYDSIVAIWNQY